VHQDAVTISLAQVLIVDTIALKMGNHTPIGSHHWGDKAEGDDPSRFPIPNSSHMIFEKQSDLAVSLDGYRDSSSKPGFPCTWREVIFFCLCWQMTFTPSRISGQLTLLTIQLGDWTWTNVPGLVKVGSSGGTAAATTMELSVDESVSRVL